MKGKHNESLSLRLFNNGKDVKMKKENKGVNHTFFEVQRKTKKTYPMRHTNTGMYTLEVIP